MHDIDIFQDVVNVDNSIPFHIIFLLQFFTNDAEKRMVEIFKDGHVLQGVFVEVQDGVFA